MATQTKLIDLERNYTSDEFAAMPDDGNRYELIKGRLAKMPPAGDEHGDIIKRLMKYILRFDFDENLGTIWATTGFVLDKDNTPEPDLMYVVASRRPARSKKALQVIPDLVVEVWSPSQLTKNGLDQESQEKIRLYQAAGVKIIWSINPDNQTVGVYHADQSEPIEILDKTGKLSGEEIIPGFKLDVARLFELNH